VRYVEHGWLKERLGSADVRVVDPRLRVRYTSGHLFGAINVRLADAFDSEGSLLDDEALVRWLGDSGVGTGFTVVVYDQQNGQAAAMLAWILEYLGHPDVRLLRQPIEAWRAEGGELFYRPVAAMAAHFQYAPRHEIRARTTDVERGLGSLALIDTRSATEFSGEQTIGDDLPGHLPSARHIPWEAFSGGPDQLVARPNDTRQLLGRAGIGKDADIVLYCRTGLRASVGFVALELAGVKSRLYDGSWADWSRVSRQRSASA
jgi:thiosulfate/3-mercaptopyruvate sulfurtransferase